MSDNRGRSRDEVLDAWISLVVQGLTMREIADRIGMSYGALQAAVKRAREAGDWRAMESRREPQLVQHEHGTWQRYNQKCRCQECRQAWSTYHVESGFGRRHRRKNFAARVLVDGVLIAPVPPELHGRSSTYDGRGCRCDACREARRVYMTKRRLRLAVST